MPQKGHRQWTIATAQVATSTRPRPRRVHQPPYPPITPGGLAYCLYWLAQTRAGKNVNPAILLDGLKGSSIRSAELLHNPEDGSPYIAFVLRSRGTDRTARNVDLATFAYVRMLTAYGGSLFIDENK